MSRQSRSLTYLFCDLVDSTGLIEHHDTETAFELIENFRALCRTQIGVYQGFVANDVGDGMLGYFGYPVALECNAEAACHCALKLMQEVDTLPGGLRLRIGIASGRGVLDSSQHDRRGAAVVAAVSSAANLAARLQALAEPGQIVVSSQIEEQLRGLFRFDSRREIMLKGFDSLQAIYVLCGYGSYHSRSHQSSGSQPSELVGRDEEVAAVLEAWHNAQAARRGCSVLVRGPGGIGKTTLLHGILQRIGSETQCLVLYSAWFAQHTALQPLKAYFEEFAAGQADGFLQQWLAGYLAPEQLEESLEVMRILLGRIENTRWMTNILREKTIAVITRLLLGMSREQPLLVLVEDIHWLDPTSAEVLLRLQAAYAAEAILILASARPGMELVERVHWDQKIDLQRLHEQDVKAFISGLDAQHQLNQQVRHEIARKAEGVPLLIREFTKATLAPAAEGQQLVVPDTLLDSFVAQLDLWAASKEILDVAATVGDAFPANLVALALDRQEDEIGAILRDMTAAGLLGCHRPAEGELFDFSHALLRDAAYAALLPRQRKEFHGKVLLAWQAIDPHFGQSQPNLAAHHLRGIGSDDAAIRTLLAGAQACFARAQFSEARGLIRQSLSWLPAIKSPEAFAALELQLQTLLGLTLTQLKGFGDDRVNQTFSRAWDICREIRAGGEPEYQAIWGIWGHKLVVSETATAVQLVASLDHISRRSGKPELQALTQSASAAMCFITGAFAEVAAYAEAARASYRVQQHGHLGLAYSMDPLAQALMFLTHSQAVRGDTAAADRSRAEVLAHADRLGLEFLLPYIRIWSRGSALYHAVPEGIIESLDEAIELARKLGIAFWVSSGILWKAHAHALLGQLQTAIPLFESGLQGADMIGLRFTLTYFRSLYAWTLARAGRASGLPLFDQCERRNTASGELCYQAEIHRLHGEALLHADASARDRALGQFSAGLRLARAQQASGWERKILDSLSVFGFDTAAFT